MKYQLFSCLYQVLMPKSNKGSNEVYRGLTRSIKRSSYLG